MRDFARMSAAVVALTLLGMPILQPAIAQTAGGSSTLIVGVADAETGEAMEGAEVVLMRLYRIGRTSSMGEATMHDVPRGAQRVRVRRLGYAPSEIDLAIVGDTTGAVFRLQRIATQLGAVKVEADWIPPKMRDVDTRRKQGIGRFLNEVDLERDKDRDFATVMTTRFPGLTTTGDTQGHRYLITTLGAASFSGVAACYVTLYLDDLEIPREEQYMIRTWDLAAVEYYTASQVPARYRTKSYKCGVMLLWSKWQ
jgi:hypothetical protein